MLASNSEVISVLRQYNPWWGGARSQDLPRWRRAAFAEIESWVTESPTQRALLLSGARQVGKTTLFLQIIDHLLDRDVPPSNILYATFDHPLLKLHGIDGVLNLWREFEGAAEGPEYLFLDEIQFMKDWQTWLKHQVDFQKHRQIAVTGSATPLVTEGQESGVGRWHTVKLATLSFYEYLQIRNTSLPKLPAIPSLLRIFDWREPQFQQVRDAAANLAAHFHNYLLRGGFPQCAGINSVTLAQKLLREDIVDKVLKRDMTALFGVRRVLELEHTFIYLCLHDGGILDMQNLCKNLEVKKPTALNFINLLEATHLIYKLQPVGYGKEVLRGKFKIYLADPAIASSVLLRGKSILNDSATLGTAVETAFFRHVFARFYQRSVGFSYWKGSKDKEVDIVAVVEGRHVPFEVKYRPKGTIDNRELRGLLEFCREKKVPRAYVITRDIDDFSVLQVPGTQIELLRIPAALACFWLGKSELSQQEEAA